MSDLFFASVISALGGVLIGGAANNIFAIRPLTAKIDALAKEIHDSLVALTDRVAFLEGERRERERHR